MAALKLKSNIMELVCRTCLKMEKVRFNIFQNLQKDKLISEMIMLYTPIKVRKDDGFPVNICNSCIEKLILTSDFIAMAIESDVKLRNFRRNKCAKAARNSESSIEEAPHIKNEETKLVLDCDDIRNDRVIVNNNERTYSVDNNCDALDFRTKSIKQETLIEAYITNNNQHETAFSLDGASDVSSESSSDEYSSSEESCTDSEKPIAQRDAERVESTRAQVPENKSFQFQNQPEIPENRIVEEREEIHQDEAVTELPRKRNNRAKQSKLTTTSVRKRRNTRLNDPRNVNEKQAELLDNPDYKRIMQMGLSKKEKENLPVFCKDCNKTFTFRYFVGIHAHIHTGNLPFKCVKCGVRFPKRPMLNQHMRTHLETKDFSCEECGKAFTTVYSLRNHKRTHSDEKPYRCEICDKRFKQSLVLQRHMRTHDNVKDHVCERCGKAFVDKGSLIKHQVTHAVPNESNFVCEVCNKKFPLKKRLDTHLKTHSPEKPHVCKHCGKSFKKRVILQHHLLIHTGEKPHTCKICGKKFRHLSCIIRHMRIHTGETPFPCELCPSAFKYKHHLLNHMKVHEKGNRQKVNNSVQ